MKKYQLYLYLILIGLAACAKQQMTAQPQQHSQQNSPSLDTPKGLRGRFACYQVIDTVYNYYSATAYHLDITRQTLTGDTAYLSAGTPNQIIKPNPIAGYNPKVALADTLIFLTDYSGSRNVPGDSNGFKYSSTSKEYSTGGGAGAPGIAYHFFLIDPNTVEVTRQITDPDGGLSNTDGWYFKKL